MKKLVILKSLIDFIWIVICIPMIAVLLFFSVYMFIEPESLDVVFVTNLAIQNVSAISIQIFGLLFIALAFGTIFCVYVFRKTLRYFQQVKPFHSNVIHNFYQIGYLLSIIGILSSGLSFAAHLFFKDQFRINLGFSPYLMIICLGLFFMVLSEVFKVAKKAKEENELTI